MSIRSHYLGFVLVTVSCCLATAPGAAQDVSQSLATQQTESTQGPSLAREQQTKTGKGNTQGQFTSASQPRKNGPR